MIKSKQKRGLGKKPVDSLEQILREKGIKKLPAQIHVANIQVQSFYEKLGFEEMTYIKNSYKDL